MHQSQSTQQKEQDPRQTARYVRTRIVLAHLVSLASILFTAFAWDRWGVSHLIALGLTLAVYLILLRLFNATHGW